MLSQITRITRILPRISSICTEDDHGNLRLDLEHFDESDINISFEGRILVVCAKNYDGFTSRSVSYRTTLPRFVEPEEITSEFSDGELVVFLPDGYRERTEFPTCDFAGNNIRPQLQEDIEESRLEEDADLIDAFNDDRLSNPTR